MRNGKLGLSSEPCNNALFYATLDERRILLVDVGVGAGISLGLETEAFVLPEGLEMELLLGFDVAPDGRFLVVARERRIAPMQVVVLMNRIGR